MTALERRSKALLRIARAIIYARVSKDEAGGRSCREQIGSCEGDCEYEGWPVFAVLSDNDRGASRHSRREREAFKQLPSILRKGDVLVVWEPSRITRDMREFGTFCDLLAERGVLLYYDGRVWDLNDDDDRNRVWQDILDGAKQAGKTRKRTLRSMSANVKEGKAHGRAAPGYRIAYDRDGKSLGPEIIPAQARVLREMASRVVQRQDASWLRLSRDYESAWRAAGGRGRFDPEDVRRILTNPALYGKRTHRDEIVRDGVWEPILDPEWLPAVLAWRDSRISTAFRGGEPQWLLTYIARCGVCVDAGKRGVVHHKKSRGSVSGHSYVCRKYQHVHRDLQRVDSHVEEVLLTLLEHPETLAKLTALDEGDGASVDIELDLIKSLRKKVVDYSAEAAQRHLDPFVVAAYVEPLQAQIREAEERVRMMTAVLDPVFAGAIGPDARQRWEGYSLLRKREIIRASLDVRIVTVARRGRYSEVGVEMYPIGPLAQ